MDDPARIQYILKANQHMVLSTANKSGKPWVTPVAYTFDENNCLYWMSSKHSRHSVNVRGRKEIAIVIFMLEPVKDALYIEAEATELINESEIAHSIDTVNSRTPLKKYRIKGLGDVSGKAAWRIYKATPKTMYVRVGTMLGDQAVTKRRKIPHG